MRPLVRSNVIIYLQIQDESVRFHVFFPVVSEKLISFLIITVVVDPPRLNEIGIRVQFAKSFERI
ncbi:MAG: hypothetical protein C4527_20085 [Candidatus Omnitrophota bacterium]|nr:MAG: hypothetical protein C4527_20085 [Candidatus Omnitrophota bacterium]